MDLEHLKIFAEVFRAGSFAKVAQRRDVDPSIISRAVAGMEEELGVALFYRTTRKITPTEAGSLFYGRVARISEDYEAAVSSAQNLRSTPTGVLRITAPVSFGVQHLPGFIAKFRRSYPEIDIDLVITDTVVDIVADRIDLAFRFGHLPDSSFVARRLEALDYVVCASPTFVREHGRPQSPSQLAEFPCVQFLINGFSDGWKFRRKREATQLALPGRGVRASNALVLRELVLSGFGIGLLSRTVIGPDLKRKALVNLFPDYDVTATDFGASIWMLYSSRDYLPEKTRLFIDFMAREFGLAP